MRQFVIILLFVVAAHATTVTGTIHVGTDEVVSGDCAIQPITSFTTPSGPTVIGARVLVRFTAGVFSQDLTPTDTSSPVSYYRVICSVPLQRTAGGRLAGPYTDPRPRYWIVPTSGSPVTINSVEQSAAPTWAQLLAGGVTWNQLLGN